MGRLRSASLTRTEVTLAIAISAPAVLESAGRSWGAAIRTPRPILLTTVKTHSGDDVILSGLIPFPHQGIAAVALWTLENRSFRFERLEPEGVDIVGHWVEVLVASEPPAVFTKCSEPLLGRRWRGVPLAFPMEGIPKHLLEVAWHVAPHVLPVALGLVTI
jgi:hypothetical protein